MLSPALRRRQSFPNKVNTTRMLALGSALEAATARSERDRGEKDRERDKDRDKDSSGGMTSPATTRSPAHSNADLMSINLLPGQPHSGTGWRYSGGSASSSSGATGVVGETSITGTGVGPHMQPQLISPTGGTRGYTGSSASASAWGSQAQPFKASPIATAPLPAPPLQVPSTAGTLQEAVSKLSQAADADAAGGHSDAIASLRAAIDQRAQANANRVATMKTTLEAMQAALVAQSASLSEWQSQQAQETDMLLRALSSLAPTKPTRS